MDFDYAISRVDQDIESWRYRLFGMNLGFDYRELSVDGYQASLNNSQQIKREKYLIQRDLKNDNKD